MKQSALLLLTSLLCTLSLTGTVTADDIDIYRPDACKVAQKMRFIFIVDNSGSMDSRDFASSKATISAAASYIIERNPLAEVAIIQYSGIHPYSNNGVQSVMYSVTQRFTRDINRIRNFQRRYCVPAGTKSCTLDHLPAALAKMRINGIYQPGKVLDVQDATNVQMFIFTDAPLEYRGVTGLVNTPPPYQIDYAYPHLGEYFALKNGAVMPNNLNVTISMLYGGRATVTQQAVLASMTSLGGTYTTGVSNEAGDPDGAGQGPRRLEIGSLTLTDVSKSLSLVDEVFKDVPAEIPVATPIPAVPASTYKQTTKDNELFYTLFQASQDARWFGNVKKYRFGNAGAILDKQGRRAINPDDGQFVENSTSFWSNSPDGDAVTSGGFTGKLGTNRNWLSNAGNNSGQIQRITQANQIGLSAFGTGTSSAERDKIYQFKRGFDAFLINEDNTNTSQPHHRSAEALHSSALPITYQNGRKVVYALTNLGGLHAIDSETGSELWHYTAGEFLPLARQYLIDPDSEDSTDSDDTAKKLYGFDGSLSVWQRKEDGREKVTLFLTKRRGGTGIYALDVSNPFTPDRVSLLWQRDGSDYSAGQSWFEPRVVTINTQCSADSCKKQKALLVGGGYDPEYDQETPASSARLGRTIALLDLDTGQPLWSIGPRELNATEDAEVQHSIVQTPASIDTNGDGAIDVLFAVDIQGNLWRYDLTRHPKNIGDLFQSAGLIAKLSTHANDRFLQPIDVALIESKDLDVELEYPRFFALAIGSGDMTRPKQTTGPRDRFYVLFDPHVEGAPTDYRYIQQGSSAQRTVITPQKLRDVGKNSGKVNQHGLYQVLEHGEKTSSPSITRGGKVAYATYMPSQEAASCNESLGEARLRGIHLGRQASLFGQNSASSGPLAGTTPYFKLPQAGIVQQLATIDFGQGEFLSAGSYTTSTENVFGQPENIRLIERRGWFEQR